MFGLSSLFGGSSGGSGYKIPDVSGQVKKTISPFFEPYTQAGTSSLSSLQEQLARMLQNPSELYNQLGQGYRESPGYQHNVQQATQAANRAAAAGGQLGSPAEQQQLSQNIMGLADQYYQNYMNQMMGIYGQGVQGLTGLTGLGYNAASTQAEDLANAQMAQAGLDVGAQKAKMQSGSDLFSSLLGLGGAAIGSTGFWDWLG